MLEACDRTRSANTGRGLDEAVEKQMASRQGLATYRPANLKLTASALFGVCPQDPLVRLFIIAGWQF